MKTKLLQILYDMRTQPVTAWVTVAGTALSIFLIIVVLMMKSVLLTPFAPESNRSRMMYAPYIDTRQSENNSSSGCMSGAIARRLYSGLDGVEKISLMSLEPNPINVKGTSGERFVAQQRKADAGFWEIFDHKLLAGRYYTPEEVEAGTKVAVVSEATARRLFGTDDAVGKSMQIDFIDYQVIGVVANTSALATIGCGDSFTPIEVNYISDWNPNMGDVSVALLAAPGADHDAIRSQVESRFAQVSSEMSDEEGWLEYHNSPFDHKLYTAVRVYSNTTPDDSIANATDTLIYVLILLIPAINLSSMLHSRMRRRVSEIGIRRAYGCTRMRVIGDIVGENLIVTVAGGIIGIAAGTLFALFYDGLFTDANGEAVRPALGMLLNFRTIGLALSACLILNLLSASLPAWQAARLSPVQAINSATNINK